MPLLMAKIRKDNLPVVVLVTIRPWKWLTTPTAKNSNTSNKIDTLLSLRNTADTALSLDAFSSLRTPPPPEFSLLQGILTVHKCATSTTAHYTDTVTNKRPLADRFGVKRDGRKVTVQLLHLPPEEYSKGGSSTGGGDRSDGGTLLLLLLLMVAFARISIIMDMIPLVQAPPVWDVRHLVVEVHRWSSDRFTILGTEIQPF